MGKSLWVRVCAALGNTRLLQKYKACTDLVQAFYKACSQNSDCMSTVNVRIKSL